MLIKDWGPGVWGWPHVICFCVLSGSMEHVIPVLLLFRPPNHPPMWKAFVNYVNLIDKSVPRRYLSFPACMLIPAFGETCPHTGLALAFPGSAFFTAQAVSFLNTTCRLLSHYPLGKPDPSLRWNPCTNSYTDKCLYVVVGVCNHCYMLPVMLLLW